MTSAVKTRERKTTIPRVSSSAMPVVRHPSRMLAGALVVIIFAMAASAIYTKIGDRSEVLVFSRPVEQGHVITDGDLRVASVAVDKDVKTVPASQRSIVVGRVATARMLAGNLVNPESATNAQPIGAGRATFGAALKVGQYPASMHPGDVVSLIVPMTSDAAPVAPVKATVASVDAPRDNSGTTSASFVVDAVDAPLVATAGGSGNLVVVVLGQ